MLLLNLELNRMLVCFWITGLGTSGTLKLEGSNVKPFRKDKIIVSMQNGDHEMTKSKEEMMKRSRFCHGENEKERFDPISCSKQQLFRQYPFGQDMYSAC
ncbi:hypothetical protein SADUNF_Sadunf02G0012000 [Salix dunnii]|uniref:Uncharacterized protein n=1 Tax=Salix dunnii TaxID=1413687 RepID=A0A835TEZ1_9ROSI|nr:hypothetical protein SADUNF_Sadunf02G0012000 [Salix dunnii]